jgi:hypothetical protein
VLLKGVLRKSVVNGFGEGGVGPLFCVDDNKRESLSIVDRRFFGEGSKRNFKIKTSFESLIT